MTPDRILGISKVCDKTDQGKSSIYDAIGRGEFPNPIRISKGRVGWRESEIDQWIGSRPVVDLRRLKAPVQTNYASLAPQTS